MDNPICIPSSKPRWCQNLSLHQKGLLLLHLCNQTFSCQSTPNSHVRHIFACFLSNFYCGLLCDSLKTFRKQGHTMPSLSLSLQDLLGTLIFASWPLQQFPSSNELPTIDLCQSRWQLFMSNLRILVVSTHGVVVPHMMEAYNNNWKNPQHYTIYKSIASCCNKKHCIICTKEFQNRTTAANKTENKNPIHFNIIIIFESLWPFELILKIAFIFINIQSLILMNCVSKLSQTINGRELPHAASWE